MADGVIASIGHSAATGDQIRAAVDAGARWSTHLGNGAHALLPRHPNYIWDQLSEDRLSAGFIFDGEHLPTSVMRPFVRAKGVERTVLVSDAVAVGGLHPGVYEMFSGVTVELTAGGRLQLHGTPYLAGAVAPLQVGVANAVRHAGVTLAEAVRMVTANPARLLGLPPDGWPRQRPGRIDGESDRLHPGARHAGHPDRAHRRRRPHRPLERTRPDTRSRPRLGQPSATLR